MDEKLSAVMADESNVATRVGTWIVSKSPAIRLRRFAAAARTEHHFSNNGGNLIYRPRERRWRATKINRGDAICQHPRRELSLEETIEAVISETTPIHF